MKFKLKISTKILAAIKKCLILVMFDFSKPCNDRDNLVIRKMKDETGGAVIESIFELKPKMSSFLVDDNSKHKKKNALIEIFNNNSCNTYCNSNNS